MDVLNKLVPAKQINKKYLKYVLDIYGKVLEILESIMALLFSNNKFNVL